MSNKDHKEIKEKKQWTPPVLTVLDVESDTMGLVPGAGADAPYS